MIVFITGLLDIKLLVFFNNCNNNNGWKQQNLCDLMTEKQGTSYNNYWDQCILSLFVLLWDFEKGGEGVQNENKK